MNKKNTIGKINDDGWLNRYIPGALLMVEPNEDFTILEASDGYFDLVGYTREEVLELFNNDGRRTIHEDDFDIANESLLFQLENNPGHDFELVCRLANKEFGYKSVHFAGKMGVSQSGKEVIYFTITDVSLYVETTLELEKEQEFNALIASFTENSYFDYHLKDDILRFSKDFSNKIGVPRAIRDFSNSEIKKSLDELGRTEGFLKPYDNTTDMQEAEISFKTIEGKEYLYQYNYKYIFEEDELTRVVGRLTDITEHKNAISKLEEKANRDALTGLYNKEVTQVIIDDFLKYNRTERKIHAFFMVELDNFQQINDKFGHLMADGVVKETAAKINKLFRKDDLIGRVGGEEFAIFVKDIKTIDDVYMRALQVCQSIQEVYCKDGIEIDVTASVGVAMYPKDGSDFTRLYANADKALYKSKNNGKNQFAMY